MMTTDTTQASSTPLLTYLTDVELRNAVAMLDQGERVEAWRIGAEALYSAVEYSSTKPMIAVEATAYQIARICWKRRMRRVARELLATVELLTMRAAHILLRAQAQAQTGHEAGHA